MTQRRDLSSWLPTLIGPLDLQGDGESVVPRRATVNFVGGSVVDNPEEERTDISMSVPGGSPQQVQYHVLDGEAPRFGGTPNLTVDEESGEIVHISAPVHAETGAIFVDPSNVTSFLTGTAVPYAQPIVRSINTTNATPATIATVVLASSLGNCTVTVHVELTYDGGATIGGNLAYKAVLKRDSGTLTRPEDVADLTITAINTGTAPGAADIDADGNEAIDVDVTGIADTDIGWIASLHIQVALRPS